MAETIEEIVEEFVDDFTQKMTQWWTTGKDNIPKASDLIEKLKSFLK